jgi:hypothetical protein
MDIINRENLEEYIREQVFSCIDSHSGKPLSEQEVSSITAVVIEERSMTWGKSDCNCGIFLVIEDEMTKVITPKIDIGKFQALKLRDLV